MSMDQQHPQNPPLCDLCGTQQAVVYCKSDSARLCLPCDLHVHGANMLSHRHLRSLICDECTSQPAAVRCIDDKKSLCVGCQWAEGRCGSNRVRYQMNCYSGCPTLAELSQILACGNDVGKGAMSPIDENTCWDTSVAQEQVNPSWMPGTLLTGSSSSSFVPPTRVGDVKQESMSQLGYTPYKDLNAICDDLEIGEGVNTIDLGLRPENNNNDLFDEQSKYSFQGAEMDGMFIDKKFSVDPNAQMENAGEASSSLQPDAISLQNGMNAMNGSQDQIVLNFENIQNLNMAFHPGYLSSNMSLSVSNMTGESSAADYQDCCVSSPIYLPSNSSSWDPTDDTSQPPRSRNEAVLRYHQKKKNRLFGKQIRYASRKARADTRKREKGRFVKAGEAYDRDPTVARST